VQKHQATASKGIGLPKPILQRTATSGNRVRRIVALEKVAGSIPVGHPPVFRIGKLYARNRSMLWEAVLEASETALTLQQPQLLGSRNSLVAGTHPEFAVEMFGVGLDRSQGDEQSRRDLPVGEIRVKQLQDL
jgi:hypothetical protein